MGESWRRIGGGKEDKDEWIPVVKSERGMYGVELVG
jgi:hypothetical protein